MSIKKCYVCDICNKAFAMENKDRYIFHLKMHAKKNIIKIQKNNEKKKRKKLLDELLCSDVDTFIKTVFSQSICDIGNFISDDVLAPCEYDGEMRKLMGFKIPKENISFSVEDAQKTFCVFTVTCDDISAIMIDKLLSGSRSKTFSLRTVYKTNHFRFSVNYYNLPQSFLKTKMIGLYAKRKLVK